MKTKTIEEAKEKLHKCGFYNGPIDKEVTKQFTAAVADAQKAAGTFADGMWGPATDHFLDQYMSSSDQKLMSIAPLLNIRSGPGTDYSIIGEITRGTNLTLVQESRGWYEVSTDDGIKGWVTKRYVK